MPVLIWPPHPDDLDAARDLARLRDGLRAADLLDYVVFAGAADASAIRVLGIEVVHAHIAADTLRAVDALRRLEGPKRWLAFSPGAMESGTDDPDGGPLHKAIRAADLVVLAGDGPDPARLGLTPAWRPPQGVDAAAQARAYVQAMSDLAGGLRPAQRSGAAAAAHSGAGAPRVSVIVPVFNVEPYLDACLGSLAAQSFADLEIIAIDDGSTDGSPAILAAWAHAEPRLRVLTQENRGLSAARNAGLDAARGDFLAFVDSDDMVEPTFVERLLAAVTQSGAELACCAVQFFEPDGGAHRHPALHAPERLAPATRDGVIDLTDKTLLAEFFPSAWNKLYARRLFHGVRFPEGLLYEDHPVFFEIGCRADRCAYVAEALYRQRRERPGAITREVGARNFDILPILRQSFAVLQPCLSPERLHPMFRQVAVRLLWERSNCLPDPNSFARFCAEAHALLVQTGVLGAAPQAVDHWIPSALSRRLDLDAAPARPFCSVVLTFADDAPFIGEMLESLARQTLRDIEVILVDNGSIDGSAAIAAARAARDRRFVSAPHPPGDLASARNAGLAAARGDHVAFFEANDLLRPDSLERLFSYAEDAGADVVVCGFDYVWPGGVRYHGGVHRRLAEVEAGSAPAKLSWPQTGLPLLRDFLALPCNKLFRRSFLQAHKLAFETGGFFEEHAFWCDVARAGPRLFYTSEPLYRVRDVEPARRVWRRPYHALDAVNALASLRRRLAASEDQPLFARLCVRLAWERLSFAVVTEPARADFVRAWRGVSSAVDDALLLSERDEYIEADFVRGLIA